ncbi:molybdate ABC transporter permease subunit [Motilimonas pumila]|uniref:Molybdenum transport system permease n=1 Tax=Motilimonas pumila TaxID=2303987 RepID=A0A418YII1_9GAMM|nr:molybdate ABC transporter permease subunit [Motilimonas pumila]RJG50422.1 molybdate ABC transporter permease [Motilimonas pumila]
MLTDYEWQALALSLKVSSVAVAASLPVGILVAWVLAKKEFWGKSLLNSVVHLPLVLPPVVTGYLLLLLFSRNGMLGQPLQQWFGLSFAFSWQGAALAAAVVAFPLMVRAIRQAFENVDPKLEQAARTLGASPFKVFYTISLPLVYPGILAGMVLAFARSLGEFGATITFVSNIPEQTQTLPLAMFSFIETPGAESEAARLCIIAIVLSITALLASEWLLRRNHQERR